MATSLESTPTIETPDSTPELSRRDFLKQVGRIAAGTVGAGYAYETAELINSMGTMIGRAEDETWPHNEPSFTWLNAEASHASHQCIVYLPGFGEMNPGNNARDWLKASKLHNIPMGYMDYSNQGTTLDTMAETTKSALKEQGFIQNSETDEGFVVHAVFRSIAGLYGLPFLNKLDMPVKSITFISSPSRLEYGDFGNLGSFMAGLPKWRAVDTMAKTMVNAYRDYEQNGFDISHNLEEGWRNTMYGANPTALHQELRVGKAINIQDSNLLTSLIKRGIIIPGYTEAVYSATYKPETDLTVHVQPSEAEYEKVFRRLGVPLQIIPAPYEGHANVPETADRLRDITQASMLASPVSVTAR